MSFRVINLIYRLTIDANYINLFFFIDMQLNINLVSSTAMIEVLS